MTGAITWEQVIGLIAIFGALGGVWLRIERALAAVSAAAGAKHDALRAELNEFQIKVASEYARNGYIRDVEERVLKRIGEVVSELHLLRTDLASAFGSKARQER